jgi:CheY-like chemotaxis protein
MYNYRYCYLLLLLFVLSVSSCRKFVELEPQGRVIPKTIEDYKLLLNNDAVFNLSHGTTDFVTDDIAMLNDNLIDGFDESSLLIYKWAELFYQPNEDDPEWNLFYKQVYTANVVIKGVSDITTGEEKSKAELIAAAKVHRAYAYFGLVNMYAKQYVAGSAKTDLGVPLLTVPDYTQTLKRASVSEVYDLILSDLEAGVAALPPLPTVKNYTSKAAAYAQLARTQLQMQNYPAALANANSCLALQSTVFDLNPFYSGSGPNSWMDGFGLPLSQNNPEVIFIKVSFNGGENLSLSPELINLLGAKDLRRHFFTYDVPSTGDPVGLFEDPGTYHAYWAPFETKSGTVQEGPTVPEMMLIKAECLARTQLGQDGLTVVNQLRRFRFRTADYTALTAGNDEVALSLILQERRRELFAKGFRLFDLKRLNTDPRFAKTVTHPLKTQQLTLAAGANRYVYPIPVKVLNNNKGMEQNAR